MHTEHLQNVQPIRVMAGWLVAVAATSLVVFGFIVLGLMGDEAARDAGWAVLAVAVGFLVGGWFTGFRTLEAPILHGVAMGVTSLVVWALLNLVVSAAFGDAEWTGLTAPATVVVVLTQIIAAVAGCWLGVRRARVRTSKLADSPAAGVRERGAPEP